MTTNPPTKQKVIWIKWVPDSSRITGGVFEPMKLKIKPLRVYTLFNETTKSRKPKLPITPVHRENCFYEDWIHDWNFHNGQFRYYTRVMDCSVWILVEY